MRTANPRKFTVFDGMFLIAAIAIALCLTDFVSRTLHFGPLELPVNPIGWGVIAVIMSYPFALTLSLAVGLLRMRKPRPRVRRIFRQPGMAAFVVTVGYLVITLLTLLIVFVADDLLILRSPVLADVSKLLRWVLVLPALVFGFAVLAIWTVLGLSVTWRAERSWVDRSGRALGAYWMISSVISGVLLYLFTQ
jgi:hypothetical protein